MQGDCDPIQYMSKLGSILLRCIHHSRVIQVIRQNIHSFMDTIYVYSYYLNHVAVLLPTLNYYFSRSEEPLWCGFEPLSGFSLRRRCIKRRRCGFEPLAVLGFDDESVVVT